MPKRLLHKKPLAVIGSGFVMVGAFAVSAWSLHERTTAVNRLIYEQCVSNETQDAVIVSILRAIPRERQSQLIVDAINALEPPDEPDCQPPKGTGP